jgi:hypothetical protein
MTVRSEDPCADDASFGVDDNYCTVYRSTSLQYTQCLGYSSSRPSCGHSQRPGPPRAASTSASPPHRGYALRVCLQTSCSCLEKELTMYSAITSPRHPRRALCTLTSTSRRTYKPPRSRPRRRPRRRRSPHRRRQRAAPLSPTRPALPARPLGEASWPDIRNPDITAPSANPQAAAAQIPRRALHQQEPARLHRLQARRQPAPDYCAQDYWRCGCAEG